MSSITLKNTTMYSGFKAASWHQFWGTYGPGGNPDLNNCYKDHQFLNSSVNLSL
jgi:hypothetical protein